MLNENIHNCNFFTQFLQVREMVTSEDNRLNPVLHLDLGCI